MIQRFLTTSGSEYEIDSEAMTWKRNSTTLKSGRVRKESGNLIRYPEIVVGQSAYLDDDAIQPGHTAHCVRTTPVTKVWDVK